MDAISKARLAIIAGLCQLLLFVPGSHAGTFEVTEASEIIRIEAQVRAAQFLTRTTFGPTQSEIDQLADEIVKVGVRTAFEVWIDNQFEVEPSLHLGLAKQLIEKDFPVETTAGLIDRAVNPGAYREFAWWHIALTGEDQLRQRLAWAIYQIAPISTDVVGANTRKFDASGEVAYLGLSNYYDMLARNAFGNYRDLLLDIALHPVMGTYLSHALNPKGVPETGQLPDENFAREIMQLFSIGVYELKKNGRLRGTRKYNSAPIETYDNYTIEAMARVFTGLYYAGTRGFGSLGRNYHEPMQMDEAYHDTDRKVILSGVELPANQSGMQDISDAIDTIVQHRNVGPNIGRLLIQRLVKSNPTSRYIRAVSEAFDDNGFGVRGDMRAVVKAVLLDSEALDSLKIRARPGRPALLVTATQTERSRLREPVLRYAAFLRAFNASSTYKDGVLGMHGVTYTALQSPYRVPAIFGYYDPDYAPAGALQSFVGSKSIPGGELNAPEFEILTSASMPALANLFYIDITQGGHNEFYWDSASGNLQPFRISIDFEEQQEAAGLDELMAQLNILLCRGAMSDATRDVIIPEIQKGIWNQKLQIRAAVLLTVTAPDCAVVQ